MEKKRIFPENTPPQNIPYASANKKLPFSYIVPEDDSIVIEQDANGVLYLSSGIKKVQSPVLVYDGKYITASCATEGADIFYTDNGDMPTAQSNPYTTAISANSTSYRFVAIKNGMVNSDEAAIEIPKKSLMFTAIENGATVSMTVPLENTPTLFVSLDGKDFHEWNFTESGGSYIADIINLNAGETLYMYGEDDKYKFSDGTNDCNFLLPKMIRVEGSLASLVGDSKEAGGRQFRGLFADCVGLVTAPALPFVVAHNKCYQFMFKNCSKLENAPDMSATASFDNYSCEGMFMNCESLQDAATLNDAGVHLSGYSFSSMYEGCTALENSGEMRLLTVNSNSLDRMFYSCAALKFITVYVDDWDEKFAIGWVNGVGPDGVFTKSYSAEIPEGPNGIPDGWTVISIK